MNCTINKKYTVFFLLLGLSSCSVFDEKDTEKFDDIIINNEKGVEYAVEFHGDISSDLESSLKSVSKLVHLSLNKPASQSALIRRALRDKELFEDVLQREGYFEATINMRIERLKTQPFNDSNEAADASDDKTLRSSFKVIFNIQKSTQYNYGKLVLKDKLQTALNLTEVQLSDITHLKCGAPVNLEDVKTARRLIIKYFMDHGHPFVEVNEPIGSLDATNKTLSIIFVVDQKYLAEIDHVKILGIKNIKNDFIFNRMTQKKGKIYNAKENETVKNKLIQTNIITNVKYDVEPLEADAPQCQEVTDKPCKVVLKAEMTEAPFRSIGFGGRYSTALGIGGQVFWHHYNAFGGGEYVGFFYRSSIREQIGNLALKFPDIGGAENLLTFQTSFIKEFATGYKARKIISSIGYEFFINEGLKTSIVVLYEKNRSYSKNIIDNNMTYVEKNIAVTAGMALDTTDNYLDPSKGLRLNATLTPYVSVEKLTNHNMVQLLAKGSVYLPFNQSSLGESNFVLALMGRFGSLFMKDFKIFAAPTKRFYSGGPNTIRSYGYQKAGPLDSNGIPIGGRSMIEGTAELRYRVNETIGLTSFFEVVSITRVGLSLYQKENILYGVGIGIRYYSQIGPVRLDIATPLKRRKSSLGKRIDAPIQLCVSIGQAF